MDVAGYDTCVDYHGTQVAGIAAVKTYNSIGVAGIAGGWLNQAGVRLIPLKIVNNANNVHQEKAVEAINYLTDLRQQGYTVIANMCFGFDTFEDNDVVYFQQAVIDAKNAGVIMVAAAGNKSIDQHSPYYNLVYVTVLPAPARWEGVMAIGASSNGATLQDEQRSSYSLYDADYKLHIVSPVNDYTNGIDMSTTYYNNNYVSDFSGTSAACPTVVGVIANILSINPELTYQQIHTILAETAEKIGDYPNVYWTWTYGERSLETGYGRLNAYKALKYTVENYGGTFNNDVTIAVGEVFNLEPGITLKFASNTGFIVNGTLNANNGNPSSNRITFTSASSTPQKGDWNWIKFDNSSGTSTLEYCDIEYAKRGI